MKLTNLAGPVPTLLTVNRYMASPIPVSSSTSQSRCSGMISQRAAGLSISRNQTTSKTESVVAIAVAVPAAQPSSWDWDIAPSALSATEAATIDQCIYQTPLPISSPLATDEVVFVPKIRNSCSEYPNWNGGNPYKTLGEGNS